MSQRGLGEIPDCILCLALPVDPVEVRAHKTLVDVGVELELSLVESIAVILWWWWFGG